MSASQDFYEILSEQETSDGKQTFNIKINKDHPIFSGHFPGTPVTPGVCTMQIGKELLEKTVEKKLMMTSATSVKFLAVINPEINPEITVAMEISEDGGAYKVKNTTSFGENIAMKLSAIYKPTE